MPVADHIYVNVHAEALFVKTRPTQLTAHHRVDSMYGSIGYAQCLQIGFCGEAPVCPPGCFCPRVQEVAQVAPDGEVIFTHPVCFL